MNVIMSGRKGKKAHIRQEILFGNHFDSQGMAIPKIFPK
jgi:hypothetical protein